MLGVKLSIGCVWKSKYWSS